MSILAMANTCEKCWEPITGSEPIECGWRNLPCRCEYRRTPTEHLAVVDALNRQFKDRSDA